MLYHGPRHFGITFLLSRIFLQCMGMCMCIYGGGSGCSFLKIDITSKWKVYNYLDSLFFLYSLLNFSFGIECY